VTDVENGIKKVASSAAKSVASTFASVKDVVAKSDTPKSITKATASIKTHTPSSVKAVAKKALVDDKDEDDEEEEEEEEAA